MSWYEKLRESGDPESEKARVKRESERRLNGIVKFCYEPHHAYHEAGHAVVAIHYGWPFLRASADANSFLGRVEGIQYEAEDERPVIALYLAGPVAQAQFLDWDFWEMLTPQVDSEDPALIADFDMIASLLGRPRESIVKEDLAEALDLVNSILQSRNRLFQAIAEGLRKKHELSYDEVLALVGETEAQDVSTTVGGVE